MILLPRNRFSFFQENWHSPSISEILVEEAGVEVVLEAEVEPEVVVVVVVLVVVVARSRTSSYVLSMAEMKALDQTGGIHVFFCFTTGTQVREVKQKALQANSINPGTPFYGTHFWRGRR